jgi:hypothetical protein
VTAVTSSEAGSVARCSGGRYGSTPHTPMRFLYLPKRAGPSLHLHDDTGLPAPLCPPNDHWLFFSE